MEIDVKSEKENNKDYCVIKITNHGIGVPQRMQARVFDKYFRAENDINYTLNGLGLGFYIAKKYIKAHKGKIYFDSREDRRTTFMIKLSVGK